MATEEHVRLTLDVEPIALSDSSENLTDASPTKGENRSSSEVVPPPTASVIA